MAFPVRARTLVPLALLGLLAGIALASPYQPLAAWQAANDREALKGRFDQVARNFAEFDAAFYSYSLEFAGVPPDAQALIDSGHLRTTLLNPYTGEPTGFPTSPEPREAIADALGGAGDIWYRASTATGDFAMAAYYLDPNDPMNTRWMQRETIAYVNEAERQVIFDSGSRADQLMRVNMEHLVVALDDYVIRFGEVPIAIAELDRGDALTTFQNPYDSSRNSTVSSVPSPGDFTYLRLDADHFDLIGWGETGPVYYYSEAEDHWGIQLDPLGTWGVVSRPETPNDRLPELPGVTWNKVIQVGFAQHALDVEREAAWAATHPDCLACGSTYVYWEYAPDQTRCRDARTGEYLDDCCCGELATRDVSPHTAPQ